VTVPAGREIVTQGSPGHRFYVVDDGEVDVYVDERLVRTLGAGDYFGEISLLRNEPRSATVRARSEVELLMLEPAEFVAAVSGHAPAAEAAEAVIGERLTHARPQAGSL
jgi:CRP-like cAMP-binding protein